MTTQESMSTYDNVFLILTFYPYNTNIKSHSFKILPYEEYVNEAVKAKKTTYKKMESSAGKTFGIMLGFFIVAVFYVVNASDLVSVESTVSIMGAYFVGKELWRDIDNYLLNLTKHLSVRWMPDDPGYTKSRFGTIQRYWDKAREIRYRKPMHIADNMDIIAHSNSKTIELALSRQTMKKEKECTQKNVKSMGIVNFEFAASTTSDGKNTHIESTIKNKTYMFISKMILSRNYIFFVYNKEIFQSIDNGHVGILDDHNMWQKNTALIRTTIHIKRIKIYLNRYYKKNITVLTSAPHTSRTTTKDKSAYANA